MKSRFSGFRPGFGRQLDRSILIRQKVLRKESCDWLHATDPSYAMLTCVAGTPESGGSKRMGRGYKKLAALLATAATIVGLATGVLTLRDQLFPRIDPPQPARPEQTQSVPHVRGHVVDSRTGQPYAGAWVEFKNLSGGNVHTVTDRNGVYDLPVPEGVYTALAGDDRDMNMGFDVVNRASNAVEVPSDSVVDFVARPIS